MPISLRFPEGTSSASIGDLELVPDENGIVVVPDGIDYSELLNHGFTPCTEADLLPIKLAAQKADEDRIEAEVQRRVKEVLAGHAVFGTAPEPAAAEAPAEEAAAVDVSAEAPAAKPKGKGKATE